MSYRAKITQLQETIRSLDKQISELQSMNVQPQVSLLAELKKKKISITEEISRLTRLEWEENTQRTGYGDE